MKLLALVVACAAFASLACAQTPLFVEKRGWPYLPLTPFLADVDNDGQPEVFETANLYTSQPGTTLSYRRLLGNGEWGLGQSFASPSYSQMTFHSARAAGDVDGDGNQDIYVNRTILKTGVFGLQPFRDLLWRGDGVGGFTDASNWLPSTRTNVQHAKFADFDGDGDLDLVLCDVSGLLLWINDGTGHFQDESARRVQNYATYEPWRCAVLDADQDGDLDVLVANGWGTFEPTVLYVNSGRGTFQAYSQGVLRIADLFVLDADGDGWDDVLAIYPTFVTVFLSRPNQTLMIQAPQLLPAPIPGVAVLGDSMIVDFDGDGDLDILASLGSQGVRLWRNDGVGFVPVQNGPQYAGGSAGSYVIDYDHDGDMDVVLGAYAGTPPVAKVFSNTSREILKLTEPVRGSMFTNDVYARANHIVAVAVSTNYMRQPFGSLGLLYLDPTQTATVAILTFAAHGRQAVSLPIPNLPGLVGQVLTVQGIDLDLTTNVMHLTNAPSATVQ